jgi:hypothetical protein
VVKIPGRALNERSDHENGIVVSASVEMRTRGAEAKIKAPRIGWAEAHGALEFRDCRLGVATREDVPSGLARGKRRVGIKRTGSLDQQCAGIKIADDPRQRAAGARQRLCIIPSLCRSQTGQP